MASLEVVIVVDYVIGSQLERETFVEAPYLRTEAALPAEGEIKHNEETQSDDVDLQSEVVLFVRDVGALGNEDEVIDAFGVVSEEDKEKRAEEGQNHDSLNKRKVGFESVVEENQSRVDQPELGAHKEEVVEDELRAASLVLL